MKRAVPQKQRPRHRSGCPVASALDLVGDRWSLLVVRSMFVGASRFRDFLNDAEAIATNVLADRLERLECAGLIEPFSDETGVGRYRLTRSGADLLPVLQALAQWGHHHLADRWEPPDWFMKAEPTAFYPPTAKSPSRRRKP
jgi:DNA-binding HxlR family transcriptional regulator